MHMLKYSYQEKHLQPTGPSLGESAVCLTGYKVLWVSLGRVGCSRVLEDCAEALAQSPPGLW